MDFSTTRGFDFEHTRVKIASSTSDQWIFPQPVGLASKMQE